PASLVRQRPALARELLHRAIAGTRVGAARPDAAVVAAGGGIVAGGAEAEVAGRPDAGEVVDGAHRVLGLAVVVDSDGVVVFLLRDIQFERDALAVIRRPVQAHAAGAVAVVHGLAATTEGQR